MRRSYQQPRALDNLRPAAELRRAEDRANRILLLGNTDSGTQPIAAHVRALLSSGGKV